jgi:hypothetical protein
LFFKHLRRQPLLISTLGDISLLAAAPRPFGEAGYWPWHYAMHHAIFISATQLARKALSVRHLRRFISARDYAEYSHSE